MSEHVDVEGLMEDIKSYMNTNLELLKLEITERCSAIVAGLIGNMLVGVVGAMFVLFISLVGGFYFSSLLGSYVLGFAIMAGFYLLLVLVLFFCKKKLVELPFRDKIIRMFLTK